MEPNQSFFQKNKKEVIIISIMIIIFLIFIITLLFLNNKKKQSDNNVGTITSKAESTSLYSKSDNENLNNKNNNNTGDENNSYSFYTEGLIKIWDRPVAGYGINENKNILFFVDSDTGYIYQKKLSEPTSTPTQITNSSFPNIREAYFLNIDGENKVVMQYSANNTIKSFIATIPEYYEMSNELKYIKNLDNNITNISISPDSSKAVYVVAKNVMINNVKDLKSDWYTINKNGINKIYSSELSSWKTQITDSNNIYVYNTETSIEKNSLYKFNSTENTLNRIYSGHIGTNYLINNNSILASILTETGINLYKNNDFYNTSFTDSDMKKINISTLSNKCYMDNIIVCAIPKETKNYNIGLPDAWYQGLTSWRDNLYVLNDEYPYGQLLFDLEIDGGVSDSLDIKDLKINKNESHLLFIDKNTGNLWSLNIENILGNTISD